MKRILSLVLALLLVFVMAGCSSAPEATEAPEATDAAGTEAPAESEAPAEETPAESEAPAANADFKVGFIFLPAARRRTPRALPTSTTRLRTSTRAVTWPASRRA